MSVTNIFQDQADQALPSKGCFELQAPKFHHTEGTWDSLLNFRLVLSLCKEQQVV